jgi:hypothetical protein
MFSVMLTSDRGKKFAFNVDDSTTSYHVASKKNSFCASAQPNSISIRQFANKQELALLSIGSINVDLICSCVSFREESANMSRGFCKAVQRALTESLIANILSFREVAEY